MSLQIVTGSSGAGKSYTIYRELIEASMQHPEKQYLVIVPEQFTMQAQKELVRMHPRKGLLNVDVLSFHRLAWRVFEEVGGNHLPILDETGKALLVQRVIAENQKDLQVLGGALHRQGSAAQIKSLFSEFLQYGVGPDDLAAWQETQNDTLLSRKINDVNLLYRAFRAQLEERFLAAEEIPEALRRVIDKSALVRGSTIVLDGFTGFTPLQYNVVRALLRLAEDVCVPITIDPAEDVLQKDDGLQLFSMSREMARKLVHLAKEEQVDVMPIRKIEAGSDSRFAQSEALDFLEKHLYRYPKKEHPAAPGQIHLREADDPRAELRAIATEILHQVRGGKHFRDFAILTGDPAAYGEEAAALFEAEGIPYFLDRRSSVMTNALIDGLRAALQMVARSYSYDSTFRYLKSGLSRLTLEEVDALENYVLATGIRGRKRYESPWTRVTGYIKEEDLAALNTLRERFVEETASLHEMLHDRKGNIRTKTEALRAFLAQQGAEEKLEAWREELLEEGELVRAKEYEQVHDALQDLLQKIADVLGNEKSGVAAYAELLDAGFAELSIGTIPPGEDQVLIGDMERTRLKKIEVLFVAGLNEGIIPRPVVSGGVLSETDRETLRGAALELAPTPREEIGRQRFYLYLAMTKPSSELFLSYAKADKAGEALLPSDLIRQFRQMFPELTPEKETGTTEEQLETADGRRAILRSALQDLESRELSPEAKEVLLSMREDPSEKELAERLLAASAGLAQKDGIGRKLAEALYGKELVNSATRLENFAACAFRHFCDYGLRLREREEYAFTPADLGSLMHAALEQYSRLLQEAKRPWKGLPEDERIAFADRALEEARASFAVDPLECSGRSRFLGGRIRELLQRTVWALQTQVEHGEFEPTEFEFRFSDDQQAARIRLEDDASMRVTGVVDRMDLCDAGATRYVKIIDYKTGKVQFDLNKLYHGLQMQLLLYLNAAVEHEQERAPEKNVEPAGVFYYHIDDPYSEALHAENVASTILRQLRPDGRCRSEDQVLELLDKDLKHGGAESIVLPVKRKKEGGFDAHSKIADKDEFETLRNYTAEKAKELGNRILGGETAPAPYQYKTENACTWCAYAGVCGFDPALPGRNYRQLDDKNDDVLYAEMKHYVDELDN